MSRKNRPEDTHRIRKSGYLAFLLLVVLTISQPSPAGNQSIDSLINKWENIQDDTSKIKKLELLRKISQGLVFSYPDSASIYYSKMMDIATANNLPEEKAYAISGQGYVKYIKGEYDFAMEKFMKAISIWDSLGHERGRAVSLNDVGLIQNMQEHYDESLKNHRKSLEISRQINDTALMATNHFNMAITMHASGQQDSALAHAQKSLSLNNIAGKRNNSIRINNIIGSIYYEKGNYKKATDAFKKVLQEPNYNNKWELAYSYAGLAKVLKAKGRLKESIEHGLRSYKLAREVGAKWDQQHATKILADAYAEQENWQKAYHYHVLHKKHSDSIFNEKRDNKINYLRLKRKESENEALAKENRLHEVLINKRNHQLIAGGAGIAALIVLAFLLYRNNYLKTRLNQNLKRKNAEIASKNEQLNELNATKDTMLRVIAHDLKNPISVVVSYTEVIAEDFDEYEREELLEIIKKLNKSSNEGLRLLENLMEWARSQTGAISVNPGRLDIEPVINENIELLHSMAKEKEITIKSNVPNSTLVHADYNLTSTVIRNLLSNAIKFTRDGGEVKLETKQNGNMQQISITDTGMGISKEDIPGLFNLKQTNPRKGTNNEKGSGLGLVICKQFTEKQGGKIWAQSHDGEGSTFHITLPAISS